jgi:hypothetical protein
MLDPTAVNDHLNNSERRKPLQPNRMRKNLKSESVMERAKNDL